MGIYSQNEIRINETTISNKSKSEIDGVNILLMDTSIDFLIMIVEKTTPFLFGSLPIDKFDCICLEANFSNKESNSLNWLSRSISFDFSKNKKIKNQIFIGSEEVKTIYQNLSNYLKENFPKFENVHNNKFQPIYEPN